MLDELFHSLPLSRGGMLMLTWEVLGSGRGIVESRTCVFVSECKFTVTQLLVNLSAEFGHVLLCKHEWFLQRQTLTVLRTR